MTSLASWELTFNFKLQYIMTEKEILEQLIDEAIEKARAEATFIEVSPRLDRSGRGFYLTNNIRNLHT